MEKVDNRNTSVNSQNLSEYSGKSRGHNKPKYVLKIILLGDWNTGKTSLLQKYCLNENSNLGGQHNQRYIPNAYEKKIRKNGYTILLKIHDTAGQERYRSITQSYYRGAHGSIIVFDVSNLNSMQNVCNWIDDLNTYSDGNDLMASVLVGTVRGSCERQVSQETADKLAEHLDVPYIEVSLDSKPQINDIFDSLIDRMLEKIHLRLLQKSESYSVTYVPKYYNKPKTTWSCTC